MLGALTRLTETERAVPLPYLQASLQPSAELLLKLWTLQILHFWQEPPQIHL